MMKAGQRLKVKGERKTTAGLLLFLSFYLLPFTFYLSSEVQ